MKIAIIGRTKLLYMSARYLIKSGHEIKIIITSKAAAEYEITEKDFEILAKEIGAKFIYTPKINQENIVNQIKALGTIDLGISINYTGIISRKVINLFPHGILNAHGGDLPRYRGNACQAWAILNKEKRIGLCIHKMVGGELDSGNILAREFFNINLNTRIGEIHKWMISRVPELMLKATNLLSESPNFYLEKQSKDPKDALRCYPRKPEDGKIFWSNKGEDIIRLINASSEPYAGAFCDYKGERMIIWRAEIYEDDENFLAVPGQVCSIDRENDFSILVATGERKIKIKEITFGGTRMPPGKLIKSIRSRLF